MQGRNAQTASLEEGWSGQASWRSRRSAETGRWVGGRAPEKERVRAAGLGECRGWARRFLRHGKKGQSDSSERGAVSAGPRPSAGPGSMPGRGGSVRCWRRRKRVNARRRGPQSSPSLQLGRVNGRRQTEQPLAGVLAPNSRTCPGAAQGEAGPFPRGACVPFANRFTYGGSQSGFQTSRVP